MKRWSAILLLAAGLSAATDAPFDYYLLVLSWAPDFCATPGGNKDPRECGIGRHVGFVVHGLWPQVEGARAPENCGSRPVRNSIVEAMLRYIPTEGLVQHEWKAHGSCSGLSPEDYFAALRKARDSVKIPAAFDAMTKAAGASPGKIERWFSAANPGWPPQAFRATCRDGALQEVRICLDRSLNPKSCPAGGRCPTDTTNILPPR